MWKSFDHLVKHYFKAISQIPRCSEDEKRISDYLVDFARQRKLEVYQDKALNVIIKKEASKGYESAPCVILQGHMDMVCEKTKLCTHDFSSDPIQVVEKEGYYYADGTSLGADNGIALAYCLAILDASDITHPPLEVIFTVQEEIGLIGASKLESSPLKGKRLINLDAEEEGTLYVSCAGGIRNKLTLPITWRSIHLKKIYTIKVTGLKGGHSGMQIDQYLGNANKILGRVLQSLVLDDKVGIVDVSGGTKVNAIPREARAKIVIEASNKTSVYDWIARCNQTIGNEFKKTDPDLLIYIEPSAQVTDKVYSHKTVEKLMACYTLIPSGVITNSPYFDNLVESSCNLGCIDSDQNKVVFTSSVRSMVASLKETVMDQYRVIAHLLSMDLETFGDYKEWAYAEDSYLRQCCSKVYEAMYGEEPQIKAIHAGLECGVLGGKLNDVDMISFGPHIEAVHSTEERIKISSIERTGDFLLKILEQMK